MTINIYMMKIMITNPQYDIFINYGNDRHVAQTMPFGNGENTTYKHYDFVGDGLCLFYQHYRKIMGICCIC